MSMKESNKEVAQRHFILANEYYKRFCSSITIASGAGIAAILSFSSQFSGCREHYFELMLPSLWGFLVALVSSGALTFVLAQMYLSIGISNASAHSGKECKREFDIQKSAMLDPDKASLLNPIKVDRLLHVKQIFFEGDSKREFKKSERLRLLRTTLVVISVLSLLFSITWPIALISLDMTVLNCPK